MQQSEPARNARIHTIKCEQQGEREPQSNNTGDDERAKAKDKRRPTTNHIRRSTFNRHRSTSNEPTEQGTKVSVSRRERVCVCVEESKRENEKEWEREREGTHAIALTLTHDDSFLFRSTPLLLSNRPPSEQRQLSTHTERDKERKRESPL